MGTELVNVEAFKSGPATAFKQAPQTESLADGIGQSYGVISYKGKVWSVRHRGMRHNIVRPDDGTPSSYLDVIILSAADHKSKSYYKDFDPNAEAQRPLCSSIDGLVPDLDVVAKQSETCALCPRNAWKLMPNGKKGRECTDYKRLAVLMLPNVSKALFGEPVMEPIFLRVPPASLNALAQMGEQMDAQGYPYFSYITRISFDPNEAHPKMVFKALQPLTDAEAPVILQLRSDPQAGRIVNGDVALPAITHVTAPVTEAAVQAPLGGTSTSAEPPAVQQTSSTDTTVVAQPVTAQPAVLTSTTKPEGVVDAGFGTATTVPETGGTSLATSQIDTGEPTVADEDLDARIAGLLKV